MANKDVTRKDLLERWGLIEQEDDDDDAISSIHPVKRRRFRQLKEQWFSDAFNFLTYLPKESHVWCGYWDLMGPLLETFYNYFKDQCHDSPLKILWKRISQEMRSCTLCVHQHHQAQEMYNTEYELSCISPLLDVLHMLDEERITLHLKDLNARIGRGQYDATHDYGEVVSVMFEVLMFPILLDDQSLATEFQHFIEAIDNSHELTLEGHQQYPVALLIILRGYRMDPPCPPSECAHMWGPSLVSSLKDSSLHSSLRQPAIDLIQTIIVSDASALISITLNGQLHPSDKPIRPTNYGDGEEEEEILSTLNIKEEDITCWKEFTLQHKIISQVDGSWMCVPMLWFDVLVEMDPLVLPLSFSKAVFWALSRFSLIEPQNSTEMTLSARNWLATCASEISYLFGWKVPSGSDDGGDGTESRNSIRTSTMCLPLVRTFKRFNSHYTIRMEQSELRKQWIWEPMMSNSLILLLVDPNDNTRQVGRLILEQVSNVRGLTCGLQFLCSAPSSLAAVLLGLRHALKLMTCIRLLELMPIVFERLPQNTGIVLVPFDNLKWLHDLADWGKSSLAVVVRYWKQTFSYLLGQIKASCSGKSASTITDIEKLILCEKVSVDELSKQVARLSVSLTDEGSALNAIYIQSKCSASGDLLNMKNSSAKNETLLLDKAKLNVIESETSIDLGRGHVIVLSDDEKEPEVSAHTGLSSSLSSESEYVDNHTSTSAARGEIKADLKEKYFSPSDTLEVAPEDCPQLGYSTDHVIEKMSSDNSGSQSHVQAEPPKSKRMVTETKYGVTNSFLSKENSNLTNKSCQAVSSKQFDSFASKSSKSFSDKTTTSAINDQQIVNKPLKISDGVVKEIVSDIDDDAWNFSSFKPPKRQQLLITKPITSGPKRQVIQLSLPQGNRHGSMRLGGGVKRFQSPRLDDWYRPILELDFFVAVGLASGTDKDFQSVGKLKEVPVCFQSPDDYVDIFRPLVLEEFKAQLQSSYQEMASAEEMCSGSLSVLSVERIDDFHVVRFVHDENESNGSKSLSENDLILLTRQPMRDSLSDVHTVGKVERREKDSKRRLNILAIRLYLQGCSRLSQARKHLTERSKWYVSRIMSITPQLREFQALSSIREIPVLPIILNPVNHPCGQYKSKTENLSKLSQPLQQILKSSYNDSQLQAISLAIGSVDLKKDFDLTLIQGPPGTGKTRTIVAIVSGLLALSQMKDPKRLRNVGSGCSSSSRTNQRISQSAAISRAWQDAALARQLNEDVKSNNKSAGSCSGGRILICAQSNAAVDELVVRISSEGLYGSDGQSYKPYLVRVGNAKTVHPNSLPFFIDTLVEIRLEEEKKNARDEKKNGTCTDSLTTLRTNLEKLVDRIRYYEAERANLQGGNCDSRNVVEGDAGDAKILSDAELKEMLRKLYEMKKSTYTDLANAQARERKASDEIRALRHKFRMAILKEAEIVVTTLSGCGGDLYGVCSESTAGHKFINASENTLFDAVVIDEAAQALEPATLIPLQLLKSKGTKCIMVGDPKQLPATVLSNVASKYLFQCSMFERLQRAGHPVIMLTQQYRMHPDICRFPSLHFYEGKLLNGYQMSDKAASFHETLCLGPYVFFDIIDGQELRGKTAASMSLYNESEADAAVELLRYFKKSYPSEFFGGRIGIITPYKRQLSLLRSRFSSAFGSSIAAEMEFNTIDGFQGREVDILLLSTVRASGSCADTPRASSNNLGFVADVRRMNVALTRAKLSLWIFGNARTLQTNQSWEALVVDAKERNLIVSGRKPYSSIYKKKTVKHSSQRKRKCTGTILESVCSGEGASPSAKSAAKDVTKRAREGTEFSALQEVASGVSSNSDNKVFKGTMSKFEENQEKNNKSWAHKNNDKEINVVEADVRKGKDKDNVRRHAPNTGKSKSRIQEHPSPVADKMRSKTNKHGKLQEVKMGASSSECSFKVDAEKEASNQVKMLKDSNMERKQQREAVDALLSSALISSKKSASLPKSSVKRTLPTTNTSVHPVRPQKRKNG
ncbi:hypothetical protein MIMGU_mgv1a000059mg [Erythranthe guttata]|uniref:Uncharacterized protein n=1 Tax=Erythranthe guttata TaxID=4155 RepID=A0A022Q3W6_ERYGU|nr:hypothetical protein MIMGU_mgv1a000059mg [Erythranthe guttata]